MVCNSYSVPVNFATLHFLNMQVPIYWFAQDPSYNGLLLGLAPLGFGISNWYCSWGYKTESRFQTLLDAGLPKFLSNQYDSWCSVPHGDPLLEFDL